jgi:hypothetical protein
MQVALLGHHYDGPTISPATGRPSQMQVARLDDRSPPASLCEPMPIRRSLRASSGLDLWPEMTSPRIRGPETDHYAFQYREVMFTHPLRPLSSIQEAGYSGYSQLLRQNQSTRPIDLYHDTCQRNVLPTIREPEPGRIAPTMYADRPRGVHTRIVRPGEPHQFGNRTDYKRGEVQSTLCRCNDPDSHGDAFTMLDSPRGFDIHGKPIDWQEVKRRMLDYHGKDQISHAEEMAAIPHVFDAATAHEVLQHEEHLRQSVRAGYAIGVNIDENNTNWHNDDGHAKPHLTEEGAKTQFNHGGGNGSRYR